MGRNRLPAHDRPMQSQHVNYMPEGSHCRLCTSVLLSHSSPNAGIQTQSGKHTLSYQPLQFTLNGCMLSFKHLLVPLSIPFSFSLLFRLLMQTNHVFHIGCNLAV